MITNIVSLLFTLCAFILTFKTYRLAKRLCHYLAGIRDLATDAQVSRETVRNCVVEALETRMPFEGSFTQSLLISFRSRPTAGKSP